jgi:methionyl-tRNA synthetase
VHVQKEIVLPVPGEDNVLITSALPYVNNVPHLGNIIGCVLSADVFARWCRQRPGKRVVYICGTDEYGTATEMKAIAEKLTPRAVCDKYHAIHKAVYEWFDIQFDFFGRTSHPDPAKSKGWAQTEIAQEIFHGLDARGHLVENSVEQTYCTGCSRFLADRFVEGECPHCGYDDARGDQCDKCGKLLNAVDLVKPRCSVNKAHSIEVRESKHLFLDLPRLLKELDGLVTERAASADWSSNAVSITRSWLRDGLQPRCITRDLKWGTPVPRAGYEDKVFYVWYDAPIGYISMTATYAGGFEKGDWRKWWQPLPCDGDVRLVQFMGKDNVPFHTVIFPACLTGSKDAAVTASASPSAAERVAAPWTVVKQLSTTEYLQYETGRFSKSRGVGVFGDNAKDTGVPADVWRYYLLSVRPETADTAFSWDDLAARNNSELLANLGNFVNRVLKMCLSTTGGKVPELHPEVFGAPEETLFKGADAVLAEFHEALEKRNLREGAAKAMALSSLGNSYVQEAQPWELRKAGKTAEADNVISLAVSFVRLLGSVFEPYMPAFAERVAHLVDAEHFEFIPDTFDRAGLLPAGHAISPDVVPLFTAITEDQIAEWRARFSGSASEGAPAAAASASASAASEKKQKQVAGGKKKGGAAPQAAPGTLFSRVELKVGKIIKAWEHPDADKLFCEEVDCGDASGPRTIASGLRAHYKASDLEGRLVVVVANLKPVTMRGFQSQGMVLCAGTDDKSKVEFVDIPAGAKVGDRIECEGEIPPGSAPEASINLKSKGPNAWTDIAPLLRSDGAGVACYNGKPLTVRGKPLTAPSLLDSQLS